MAAQLTTLSAIPTATRCGAAAGSKQQILAAPRHMTAKATFFTTAKKSQRMSSTIVKVAANMVNEAEVPTNYALYETMLVLRPDMSEEQRDVELARFEAFLKKENAQGINVTVRGRQRLAYPIKRFFEGVYVLYTYAAASDVSAKTQKMLSTPEAGAELNILRHMTFRL